MGQSVGFTLKLVSFPALMASTEKEPKVLKGGNLRIFPSAQAKYDGQKGFG